MYFLNLLLIVIELSYLPILVIVHIVLVVVIELRRTAVTSVIAAHPQLVDSHHLHVLILQKYGQLNAFRKLLAGLVELKIKAVNIG
jgi:hypothetical protein